jgi:hypothetical protein
MTGIWVLALIIHVCLVTYSNAYFEDFEFQDAVAHEEIDPVISRTALKMSPKIRISFSAYQNQFDVHLTENRQILTQDFHVMTQDEGGKRGHSYERDVRNIAQECKYYQSDDETLSATISICRQNQVSGLLSRNGSTFLIRSHGHESDDDDHDDDDDVRHSIFHYEEIPCPTGKCLDTDPIQKIKTFLKQRARTLQPRHRTTDPSVTLKYIELGLVYDKATLDRIEKIRGETVISFTFKLVHAMNSVYSKLGISVVLKTLILWSEGDKITMYDDIEDTLMTFADYNIENFDPKRFRDATLLISSHRFIHSAGILGVALKRQTCENCELAVAVITFGSDFDVTHLSGVASHELGHCLGFDDEFYAKESHVCYHQCKEPVDKLSCIMRAVYTSGSTAWSACTKKRVNEREVLHSYDCLYNQPNMSAQSICGNGVTEKDEECDCMAGDSACAKCCNTSTCTLNPGSQCGGEMCCNMPSCTIEQSARVCRPARDPKCDIEDKCDGVNAVCYDNHVEDETECGDLMWCMGGRCEYKCLKNCYGNGDCVQQGNEWKCDCRSMSFGRYCHMKFSFTILFVASFICFVVAFLVTIIAACIIKTCLMKK